MVPGMEERVAQAVGILRRFPGLRVRVEGYGAPSAPAALGRALSQARAVAIRRVILQNLLRDPGPRALASGGENPWAMEDSPEEAVEDPFIDELEEGFDPSRLVGSRIRAIGLWGSDPMLRNANFFSESILLDSDDEAKFRRVDFTVIGLCGLVKS